MNVFADQLHIAINFRSWCAHFALCLLWLWHQEFRATLFYRFGVFHHFWELVGLSDGCRWEESPLAISALAKADFSNGDCFVILVLFSQNFYHVLDIFIIALLFKDADLNDIVAIARWSCLLVLRSSLLRFWVRAICSVGMLDRCSYVTFFGRRVLLSHKVVILFACVAEALLAAIVFILANFHHKLHIVLHNHMEEVCNIALLWCHRSDNKLLL